MKVARKGGFLNLSATAMFSFVVAVGGPVEGKPKSTEVVTVSLEQLSGTIDHLDMRISKFAQNSI